MNTDPVKFSSEEEGERRVYQWRNHPLMTAAYHFKTKAQRAALKEALMAMDFGSPKVPATLEPDAPPPEHPDPDAAFPYEAGPSLWALRGLLSVLYKGKKLHTKAPDGSPQYDLSKCLGQLNLLNEFFREAPAPLPACANHLWPLAWQRNSRLRDLASQAQGDPTGPSAELMTHLITHCPDVIRWALNHRDNLRGPALPEDHRVVPSIYVDKPDEVITTYEGKPFFSLLVPVIKADRKRETPWLPMILALDPYGHHAPETREQSLVEVALTYQADALLAYARTRLDAEHIVQSAAVTDKGKTMPLVLLRKGRLDEFRREVTDVNQRDAQGLTYFHHLLGSWIAETKDPATGQYVAKTEAEAQEDMRRIMAKWTVLLDMGGDPTLPCLPPDTTKITRIKSGPNKGRPTAWTPEGGDPIKWAYRDAYPGETPMDSLRRRITPDRAGHSAFPEAFVDLMEVALRHIGTVREAPAQPERRRARMRS